MNSRLQAKVPSVGREHVEPVRHIGNNILLDRVIITLSADLPAHRPRHLLRR